MHSPINPTRGRPCGIELEVDDPRDSFGEVGGTLDLRADIAVLRKLPGEGMG